METRFPRLLLLVATTLPLAGCMTAAEQQEQAGKIAATDDAACRSAGLKAGTPAYVKCREDREKLRVSQIEADRANQRMIFEMNQMNARQWMMNRP